jgi:glycosyltransferase involved in cell wall biosynthesis
MPDHSPVFSLVVPTLGRDQEVRALLESLTSQTFSDFEVFIIDQNQDDRLNLIITGFQDKLNVTQVRQPSRGASAARNAGLKYASGKIITFPDDDCTYPARLLEEVFDWFKNNPTWDGITISARDIQNKQSVARFSKSQGEVKPFNILKRVIEAGIFVKRASLEGISFDENLGVGAHTPWWSDEGPDFILRLLHRHKRIMFVPRYYIHHPDPVASYDQKAQERSYRYGCGRGRFLKKHDYPFWFVTYVLSLYPAGMLLSLLQLKPKKFNYYLNGQKGRLRGYFSREKMA